MADAFRGLTLRLGADARPLQSAISSITRSAAQAQKQMNRLNKALKFDGTNVKMMQARLDLVGDKALHSARAVSKIQTAIKQASNETLKFSERSGLGNRKLQNLANSTTEAYAATQKLRSEQTHVAAELQHIYDAAKKTAQVDMSITWKKADKYVKGLQRNLSMGGAAAERAEKKLSDLFSKVDSKSSVFQKFGIAAGDVKELEERFYSLRAAFKAIDSDLKNMNKVEGFRAMKNEAQVFQAELRQAASEAAMFRTEMLSLGTKGNLAQSVNQIKRLDSATETAVNRAHQMIDAYRAMPKSIDAFQAKVKAVSAAEATLAAKTNEIKAAIAKIKADPAFDKLAASSKDAYANAMRVEQEYEELDYALKKATARAERLRDVMNEKVSAGVDQSSKKFQRLSTAVEKAETNIKNLKAKIASLDDAHAAAALTMELKKLESQLMSTATAADRLHSKTSKLKGLATVGKSFREFGFGMYASMTPAMMMLGRYMVQAAEDTDAAYRDMRKTVNGADADFEQLLDNAIKFSTTHITTAEQMLEIEAIGGQLGITIDKLESFAHTVSNLDIATNMESEDIAVDLGKMATVLGITEDQYDNFGDALVRLGNNLPVMEGDIMNLTNRFMGMAKVVGMSPDQMLGWAAAASATGMRAEAAGSSMQRFISKVETAVNSSDEDLQRWADVAGMSCDEFRQAFQEDASGTLYKFVEGLGDMQKRGESVNQVLGELGINNVRDKQLLEGLANQMANATDETNVLRDALQMADEAYRGVSTTFKDGRGVELAGDAMREAEKKSEGFSGEIGKMRNQATALMVELGKGAQPIVHDLGAMFEKLSSKFQEMPDSMKTFMIKLGGAFAAAGPATVGLGTFLMTFDRVAAAMSTVQGGVMKFGNSIANLGAKMKSGGTGLMRFGMALEGLGTTMGMLKFASAALAIALLSKMIGDYIKKQQDFKTATEGSSQAIQKLAGLSKAEAGDIKKYQDGLSKTAKGYDELIESSTQYVKAQRERADATEQDITKLATARQTIDKYMNTDLSGNVQAQGELLSAVEMVNEVCGTEWQVIDLVNGKLADQDGKLLNAVASIDQYIQAKQRQIQMDAMAATLTEEYTQMYEEMASLRQQEQELQYLQSDEYLESILKTGAAEDAARKSVDEAVAAKQRDIDATRELIGTHQQNIDMMTESFGALATAADPATRSIKALAEGESAIMSWFGDDKNGLKTFSAALEEAGVTVEEFNNITDEQWLDALQTWDTSGGKIKDVMDSLGLTMRTVSEQYQAEMESVQGSTEAWEHAMSQTGMTSEGLANALSQAGISANDFANVSQAAFDNLYAAAGEDINGVKTMLDLLNAAGIDPMYITVEDGELKTAGGDAIEFEGTMARIGDRTFEIKADGNFEEVKAEAEDTIDTIDGEEAYLDVGVEGEEEIYDLNDDISQAQALAAEGIDIQISAEEASSVEEFLTLIDKLQSLGSIGVTTSIDVDISGIEDAASTWDELSAAVEAGTKGDVTIDYSDATNAISELDRLASATTSLPDGSVNVSVTGGALGTIWSIGAAVGNLPSYKEILVHTRHTESHASGGIIPAHAAGGMLPAFASGAINGIATRAMLTNVGLVGEAGAEAILHMRHAGGAIVPLSNRRYVRPFARAVASEMTPMNGYYSARGGDTYHTVINTTGDGDKLARTLTSALAVQRRIHGR